MACDPTAASPTGPPTSAGAGVPAHVASPRAWTCRARGGRDRRRRPAPQRLGLDFDDAGWEPIEVPGHWRIDAGLRRHRRAAALPAPLRARPRAERRPPAGSCSTASSTRATSGSTAPTSATPRATSSRTPSRSPSSLGLGTRARAGGRGRRARRQRDRTAKRNITGVFQHWDCLDPRLEPGRHLAAGAGRAHRPGAHRPPARAVPRGRRRPRADLRAARRARQRRRPRTVARPHHGRRRGRASSTSTPLAAGRTRSSGRVDVDEPALWWPWSLGDQPLYDGRPSRSTSTARSATRRQRPHRLRQVALQQLDAARSTASGCS